MFLVQLGVTVQAALVMLLMIYTGVWLEKRTRKRQIEAAEDRARLIEDAARTRAEHLLREARLQAREEALELQQNLEREHQSRLRELDQQVQRTRTEEDRYRQRQEELTRLEEELHAERVEMRQREEELARERGRFEELQRECRERLEHLAGLSADEARRQLIAEVEQEARRESSELLRRIEVETRETAQRQSRAIIAQAIHQCAAPAVTETTVSVVHLASEDMKGRIIGREGRNIRSLEATTGVNIIVDDTPEAVVLSCFDPMRREIARIALERLLDDGRIHPARIEEVVAQVQSEVEETALEAGLQACSDCGIHEPATEVLRLLGRLKYRTSFGQNILAHSVEVAHLMSSLASELGVDPRAARRAGLFHDIGKAVSSDVEGPHALVGARICQQGGESAEVVHAIAAHHNDEEPRTVMAVLLQAADAVSAARPGARRESLDKYIQKLEQLEEIATSFHGVSRAFALQAGREIRIIVEPSQLSDAECTSLAREVAHRIHAELQFPGQIKVTVVRELRVVDFAR